MSLPLDTILSQLTHVRQSGRDWIALCPAHNDRSPSLAVREGERAILLKCWAGCSLEEICQALGLHVRDLFYDTDSSPQQARTRQFEKQYKTAKAEVEQMVTGFQIDAVRESERFLKTTVGTDISILDDTQLNTLMISVCDALAVRLEEERGNYVNG